MAKHKEISLESGVPVYFADPGRPWQRGTNENTNGLIRQYLPKGRDLTSYSINEIEEIENLLNNRPRKCLDFQSPKSYFKNL